jgi:hypothetical protein
LCPWHLAGSVTAGGNDVVDKIQRYGVKTLTDLRNDYKSRADDVRPPTLDAKLSRTNIKETATNFHVYMVALFKLAACKDGTSPQC